MPNEDPPDLAILNVDHPDHAAWERGNPDLVVRVENAFKAKYGEGSTEPSQPDDLELDEDLKAVKARFEGGAVDPEAEREAIAKENHEIEMSLRADPEWETNYDFALTASMNYARDFLDGDDEMFHTIAQVINEKFGPAGQVKILKQLWKMARARQ